ncbi:MAG: zinc ribbon domain-containing protein [Atopobiaceae bacterium]
MYCTHCGAFNEDSAKYCTTCGALLTAAGNHQNAENAGEKNQAQRSQAPAAAEAQPATPDGRRVFVPGSGRGARRHASAGVTSAGKPVGTTSQDDAARTVRANAAATSRVDAAQTVRASAATTSGVDAAQTAPAAAAPTQRVEPTPSAWQAPAAAASAAAFGDAAGAQAQQPQQGAQAYQGVQPNQAYQTAQPDQAYQSTHSGNTQAFRPVSAEPMTQAPVPSPEASPYVPTPSKVSRRTPALVACVIVAALAVALFATTAAGYGPLANLAKNSSQAATTASSSSGNSGSVSSSTSDNTDSNSTNTDSGTTGTSSSSSSSSSTSSDGTTQSQSSTTSNGNTTSTSTSTNSNGDVVANGDGTVSSTSYGYTLAMPSQFTSSQTDGTTTTYYDSADDVTITLWGDDNPDGQTVESAYHAAKENGSSAAYVAHGKNWVVYSDESQSGGVVYDMTYYQSGKTCHMQITYPTSSKSAGDAIVNKVQPTFKLTK